MLTKVLSLLSLVGYVPIAAVLVLCGCRDRDQPFFDALVARVLRRQTSHHYESVRFCFGVYGGLQRLVFRPVGAVDTPAVKGLWYEGNPALIQAPHPQVTVLYVHGGGFVTGSATTQSYDIVQPLIGVLNKEGIGARAFSLEYDLAPEHQYPHQFHQTVAAYTWLQRQNPGSILVVGDSAGGNLIALLLQHIVREGLSPPVATILVSPWVDVAATAPSYTRNCATDVFHESTIHNWRDLYLATQDDAKRASPLFQLVEGFPPTMVVYGAKELMADDIDAFVAKLRDAKVDVTALCHPLKLHNYPAMLRHTASAAEAYVAMGNFVANLMGTLQ
ncbi:hypothetical protein ACHHYP_07488 [Achlya hypogyna]|uniref:Alpha/beta hydrolase fold-3 domain-containing protein n=1 Tax=Achlya hypogyna TaxID=1202772 RepID=A0A1V9ZLZ9_ACHHY|nr:hypothetical protein ACHHYP_07488 [Achlya hypogyna]